MAAEESPLPTSTRRLFGAGNMLVLLVISATLISLFALQLDIAVPWHSAWSSKANNDTHAVTSPMIDVSDPETKYRLANEAIKVPTIESLKGVKDNYKWYTDAKLRWLAACMARGDCPANADKVSSMRAVRDSARLVWQLVASVRAHCGAAGRDYGSAAKQYVAVDLILGVLHPSSPWPLISSSALRRVISSTSTR
jgi:hypothetical protein